MPKKIEEDIVPTGIIGLDKAMKGGFEKESINLVEGGAGSGKTILAIQFILDGIDKYNEPGVFVTFEETKKKIFKHMLKLGWDLEKYEKTGKFIFLEHTPEQVKDLLNQGGGSIEEAVERIGAKRIVIDSITAFALLSQDELSERESCLALFNLINKWGCTAMLTSEHEPGEGESRISAPLEFEVDSIILLYNLPKKDRRERMLEILKMRGAKHSNKIFPIRIKKGIEVLSKKI